MTKLSVNVNKIATLRNARGGNTPNVLEISKLILSLGAHGITVHPRPDGRHIRPDDVRNLADLITQWNSQLPPKGPKVEFNIEGYPDKSYLELLKSVKFDQATLVPDPPDVLTSNAGWQLKENQELLRQVTAHIHDFQPCRVSLFVDPFAWNEGEALALTKIKADRIELYTEAYAKALGTGKANETLTAYRACAEHATQLGVGVNAGHDLDHLNLGPLCQEIPSLIEVSIGHALVSQALIWGLERTVQTYLNVLSGAK